MLNPCLSSVPARRQVGRTAPRAISDAKTMQPPERPPGARARDQDYLAYRREVIALLRARFGSALNDSDREDLYQEAWAGLLDHERRGRPVTEVGGLLKTIAWRRARDRLRNFSAEPRDPGDGALSALLDVRPTPDEQAEVKLDADLCRELIDSLGERQRTLLKLRCEWQLSPAEIQALLGIGRKAYEKALTRALKRVAAAVGEVEDGTWHERRRELLLACEAGTATEAERERARRLVERDPAARAMLRRIRGVAALAPLPLLPSVSVGLRAALVVRRLCVRPRLGAGAGAGMGKAAAIGIVAVAAGGLAASAAATHHVRAPARAARERPAAQVVHSRIVPVRLELRAPRPRRHIRRRGGTPVHAAGAAAPPSATAPAPARVPRPAPRAVVAPAPRMPPPRRLPPRAPVGDGSHEFGP